LRRPDERIAEHRGSLLATLPVATFLSYLAIAVVEFAVPFVAVSQLGAGALVVAILGICRFAPQVLLAGLAARVVDAHDQRFVMLSAEVSRAVAFAGVAAALLLPDGASLVAFGAASVVMAWASTLTAVSIQVLVPFAFSGASLRGVYSRLSIAESLGDGTGPFVAGLGLAALTAPSAFGVSAALAAVACVLLVRVPRIRTSASHADADAEPEPDSGAAGGPTRRAGIRQGLMTNLRSRPLAILMLWAVAYNLGQSVIEPLILVSLLDSTPLTAASYGIIRGGTVLLAVVGAALASRLPASLRNGRGVAVFGCTAIGSYLLVGVGAAIGGAVGLGVTVAGFALDELSSGVVLVLISTYRGRAIPLRDRANATAAYRSACIAAVPVGLLIGGAAGSVVETSVVMLIVGAAMALAGVPLLLRPVRRITID